MDPQLLPVLVISSENVLSGLQKRQTSARRGSALEAADWADFS